MRHAIIKQPKLPTGPNPLAPLDEFVVRKTLYDLSTKVSFGRFEVSIDHAQGVGFFECANYRGQFWLAGLALKGSDHLMPMPVQQGLALLGYII